MYNNYYFKPSKYCLIYFIIVNTLASFLSFFQTAMERKVNTIPDVVGKKSSTFETQNNQKNHNHNKVKTGRESTSGGLSMALQERRRGGGAFSIPPLTSRLRLRKKKPREQKQNNMNANIYLICLSIFLAQSSASNSVCPGRSRWSVSQDLRVGGERSSSRWRSRSIMGSSGGKVLLLPWTMKQRGHQLRGLQL